MLQITQIPLFSFLYQITQTWLLYIFLNIVASLVATLNLLAQFLLLELFVSLFLSRVRNNAMFCLLKLSITH